MPMSAARHAWRRAAATVLAAGAFAGRGQASRPAPNEASATPRPAGTQTARQRLTPLVYIWRNLEYAATPDEMTVYTNNEVRYRNHSPYADDDQDPERRTATGPSRGRPPAPRPYRLGPC